jgi:hypothetical protein
VIDVAADRWAVETASRFRVGTSAPPQNRLLLTHAMTPLPKPHSFVVIPELTRAATNFAAYVGRRAIQVE